jgi:hypothetical protein
MVNPDGTHTRGTTAKPGTRRRTRAEHLVSAKSCNHDLHEVKKEAIVGMLSII